MANNKLSPELRAELARLSILAEDEIDTHDIPEIVDWSSARRGAFLPDEISKRGYDVRALANWFILKGRETGLSFSNMSLNKLIFFAVEKALADRHVLLTGARIEAWDHGPVFREVYQAFKGSGEKLIVNLASRFSIEERRMVKAIDVIDREDEGLLMEVLQSLGRRSAAELRAISHRPGGAWHTVWHYRGSSNPGMEISLPIIFSHAPKWRDPDAE